MLIKLDVDYYKAYVFNTDDEINTFLDAFALSPADTNKLITKSLFQQAYIERESLAINEFIRNLDVLFPSSKEIAAAARSIQNNVYNHNELIQLDPDRKLVAWIQTEFKLFKALELRCYGDRVAKGFSSVDKFVELANEVLNRRKSRAGKSLEHHLSAIFDYNGLSYSSQAVTEGNKRPDFIFPSVEAYHDKKFPLKHLVTLAAKTTCKDRWRQILNEADRVRNIPKFLCTLQQGISSSQLDEMWQEQVILVVPESNLSYFPKDKRDSIMTLLAFIKMIRSFQS